MNIKDYYDFAEKYALLQRDKPKGVGVGKTLFIKSLVLIRVGINENRRLWNVSLAVLQEILDILNRSKK